MIAALFATLIAVATFCVGRHSYLEELRTGMMPASYYALLCIVLFVGGPLFFFMRSYDFVWHVACDVLGMLFAMAAMHFGYGLVRPRSKAQRPHQ